ncbi:Ig-like domain-containing protein, partial [Algibacter sp. PT7-4]|uniref:Ig-like domain-containing protein n=1 Tax=Algibacter ulvanivorans TaxID=3400999 RepID=UPI003AADBAEF
MKISTRFSLRKSFSLLAIMCIYLFAQNGLGQTIPATDGNPGNCSNCAPAGWFDAGGTPDISNSTTAADAGTGGGGTDWVVSPGSTTNINLPLPPNGHTDWLSLRDLGSGGTEESVSTTIGGLTVGEEYEVVAYSLTAVTEANGSGLRYAGVYNDQYTFEAGGSVRVVQLSGAPNVWRTDKLRFLAGATSETLIIRPGANGAATGTTTADFSLFETVQVSITVDAVNEVPVADSNTTTTLVNNPTTFNVTSTDVDNDGNIDDATVDLDPSTPGIQNSLVTADGTWSVDSSGNVTFSPVNGFVGTATIPYTVNDDYTLDGVNASATSNPANLSVTVLPDSDGDGVEDSADLDNDNDGILDEDECKVEHQIGWFHNANGGTSDFATFDGDSNTAPTSSFSGSSNISFGSGLDESRNYSFTYILDNADQDTFADAKANNDYVQMSYTVASNVVLSTIGGGFWTNASGDEDAPLGFFKMALEMSTNASFSTATVLFQNKQIGDLSQGSTYVSFSDDYYISLTAGTTYYFRFYLYDEQNNDVIDNRLRFDDIYYNHINSCDTDGDGIPDYQDTDSDNDGCPDAIEGADNLTTSGTLSGGSNGGSSNNLGTQSNDNGIPLPLGTTGGNETTGQATTTGVTTATQVAVDATALANKEVTQGSATTFTITSASATNTTSFTGPISAREPDYGAGTDASSGINYQWYIGDPNSGGTLIMPGNPNYSGEDTITLNILDVTGLNGTQYCLLITHDDNDCINEVNCATLTVNEPPVADDETIGNATINTDVPVNALDGDNDPDGDNNNMVITEVD